MITEQVTEQRHDGNNAISLFAGLLFGGLAGAVTMLLVAPQPGVQTRAQIRQKSLELRDLSAHKINDATVALNSRTRQITTGIQTKAEELEQQGRELVIKQLDHVSAAVEAGKTAIQGSDGHTS
jgi:gas vesicle protein